jgi:hypothetical protein
MEKGGKRDTETEKEFLGPIFPQKMYYVIAETYGALFGRILLYPGTAPIPPFGTLFPPDVLCDRRNVQRPFRPHPLVPLHRPVPPFGTLFPSDGLCDRRIVRRYFDRILLYPGTVLVIICVLDALVNIY